MFLAGFEPSIPASERPQTHASDRAVTGTNRGTTVQIINAATSSTNNKWSYPALSPFLEQQSLEMSPLYIEKFSGTFVLLDI